MPTQSDKAFITKGYFDEVIEDSKRGFQFVGYVTTTEPTENLKSGNKWYNSDSAVMPTTFPILVKTYDGTAWSTDTEEYTPTALDLWANKNNNQGYYWFGDEWNLIDAQVIPDNTTIDLNALGQIQVADEAITDDKVNPDLKSTEIPENSAVDTKLTTENAVKRYVDLKAPVIINYNSSYYAQIDMYRIYKNYLSVYIKAKPAGITHDILLKPFQAYDEAGHHVYVFVSDIINKKQYMVDIKIDGDEDWFDLVDSSLYANTDLVQSDNITIDYTDDGKLEVKDEAITDDKINPTLKSTSIPIDIDDATDAKLTTEKAVKTELDKKLEQYSTMPTAGLKYTNKVVQFIGTTSTDYKYGRFYQCVEDSGAYSWKSLRVSEGDIIIDYSSSSSGYTTEDMNNVLYNFKDVVFAIPTTFQGIDVKLNASYMSSVTVEGNLFHLYCTPVLEGKYFFLSARIEDSELVTGMEQMELPIINMVNIDSATIAISDEEYQRLQSSKANSIRYNDICIMRKQILSDYIEEDGTGYWCSKYSATVTVDNVLHTYTLWISNSSPHHCIHREEIHYTNHYLDLKNKTEYSLEDASLIVSDYKNVVILYSDLSLGEKISCYFSNKKTIGSNTVYFFYSTPFYNLTENKNQYIQCAVTIGKNGSAQDIIDDTHGESIDVGSSDGMKYEERTEPITSITFNLNNLSQQVDNYLDVCYGNGKFVIIAYFYQSGMTKTFAITSTDGINWTYNHIFDGYSYNMKLHCINNKFYLIDSESADAIVYTSADGISWSLLNDVSLDTGNTGWHSISFNDDNSIGILTNTNLAFYARTTNGGSTWEFQTVVDGATTLTYSTAYGNGKFVISMKNKIYYSTTATSGSWTEATIAQPPSTSSNFTNIRYLNNKFFATANNTSIYSSVDGITWQRVTVSGANWNDILWNGTHYIIIPSSTSSQFSKVGLSENGITWSICTVTVQGVPVSGATCKCGCYGNNEILVLPNSSNTTRTFVAPGNTTNIIRTIKQNSVDITGNTAHAVEQSLVANNGGLESTGNGIKVKTGTVASGDTGFVTGGNVYETTTAPTDKQYARVGNTWEAVGFPLEELTGLTFHSSVQSGSVIRGWRSGKLINIFFNAKIVYSGTQQYIKLVNNVPKILAEGSFSAVLSDGTNILKIAADGRTSQGYTTNIRTESYSSIPQGWYYGFITYIAD